jgi:hypothetical protein
MRVAEPVSGEAVEYYQGFVARPRGPGAVVFWISIVCNVVVVQIFWSGWARRNAVVLWVGSLLIQLGMWSERFVIVVQSLERDFLPSAWHAYRPTWVDLGILGTIRQCRPCGFISSPAQAICRSLRCSSNNEVDRSLPRSEA